jgi:proline iminopeptidase
VTAPGRLLDINGTRLFADIRGPEDAPPLLFIHGGPGQSCYDFMHTQGDRLAKQLRIIGIDQRGLLRSDPLPDGTPLTMQTLVDDFDAVRTLLGIESWTILGHSAGGAYALSYAHQHPQHVRAAIYDCPCWDGDLTDRYRMPVVADLLERYGETEAARICRAVAATTGRLKADENARKAMQQLGDHYNELFFHQSAHLGTLSRIQNESGFTEQDWLRGTSHLPLLAEMYEPRLPLLAELRQSSLLLHGRYDLVAAPQAIQAFREEVSDGTVHTFEESGHFAYIEEPDEYARIVTEFVLTTTRTP